MICSFDVPYEAMVWARQEEENELRALRTLLAPGDHFVDCGAPVQNAELVGKIPVPLESSARFPSSWAWEG